VSNTASATGFGASKKELWARFLDKIMGRKQRRLQKILDFIDGRDPTSPRHAGLRGVNVVSNDDIQKLLRVSDSTAARYLKELEQQGKLRREGSKRGARYFKT
jgi:Fic family protein